MTTSPTALIIGASRGLGLALTREWLSRGWTVVATVRAAGHTALHETAEASGGRLRIEQLEMTDFAAVNALRERLSDLELDLLFVNAGVANGAGDRVDQVSTEEFTRVMVTNALSPMRIVESLGDLVRQEGTIAVMSSGLASITENVAGVWDGYSASKVALNMLVRGFASRHSRRKRAVILMAPGWVRTDMGGPEADLDIHESVPRVVDIVTSQIGRPGLRFLDYTGRTVAW